MNLPYENSAFHSASGNGLFVPGGKSRIAKGAKGRPSSPSWDFARKHWGMVGISRDLHLNSGIPAALKDRLITYVLGEGLHPEPHIDAELAGISKEEAKKYQKLIAKHYKIWENDDRGAWDRSLPPVLQERLAFITWIVSGDFFFMLPYANRKNWPYRLSVKLIAPDYVRTPDERLALTSDRDIINGIERDEETGMDKYYWIANYYEDEKFDAIKSKKHQHKAYQVFDSSTERRYIYHAYSPERIEQRRGLSFIAPVVELIHAVTMLTESQLISAIIQSYFNVFITSNAQEVSTFNEMYRPEEIIGSGGATIDQETGEAIQYEKEEEDSLDIELGSGGVFALPEGKDIKVASPNRESNTFAPFFEAIVKQIGAALGIAYEVLMEHFSDNYSASRAAILMSFKKFCLLRSDWIKMYKKPVYEEFILDLSLQGIIPVAPEVLVTDPWTMAVWSNIQWRGPTMGHIQPEQEAKAATERIKSGLTTREMEAKDYSPDISYDDIQATREAEEENIARMTHENNQAYPLNGEQKVTLTRKFIDEDEGGEGDLDNPNEKLKQARQEKKEGEQNEE